MAFLSYTRECVKRLQHPIVMKELVIFLYTKPIYRHAKRLKVLRLGRKEQQMEKKHKNQQQRRGETKKNCVCKYCTRRTLKGSAELLYGGVPLVVGLLQQPLLHGF